jgi:hypothetical protein
MGGAANPILGSFLNGIGTNILAGNDPVKGALINASALAGSGNMGGAMSSAAPSAIPPPTSVIPGINGGPTAAFYTPASSTAAASQYQIPGLVGGSNQVFSNPAVMSPPPIQGLVGGPSNVFSNPYTAPTASQTFPLASASNVPAPIVEMGTKATSPSYWEQFKGFSRENPMLTQMGFATAKDVLTPEQIAQAPAVPVQARGQLRDYNPMASMDPYRQSVISNQPISLLG